MALLANSVGILGVALVLLAYFLLQTERMDALDPRFSWLNGLGALMIVFSLFWTWNLPSFLMESAWAGISFYKIWQLRKTS